MPWIVDGMNVIGAVPDGWWRDRTGAMARLLAVLGPLAAAEGPVELVLDGRPRDLGAPPPGVAVTWAPGPGPDAADRVIAARVQALGDPGAWRVATSDRALAAQVRAAGCDVVGARAFRDRFRARADGQTRTMATDTLQGKTVAIIATTGVEQVELERPRQALDEAGATTHLIALDTEPIQAMNSDINKGDTFTPDKAIGDVSPGDYDAVVLPGGTVNPDNLRVNADVISFVQEIAKAGKIIGAICHGPWTLVEADLVRGRTLTSYPSIRTDIRNAGGEVVDEEVVCDQGLVTSRNPDDLDAFCAKLVEEVAEGEHQVAPEGATA